MKSGWIWLDPVGSGFGTWPRRTMQTDKRSMCAANSRRSSESLTLSALFGGTDHWPKPEIDGNEEEITWRSREIWPFVICSYFFGSLSSPPLSLFFGFAALDLSGL